MRNNFFLFFFLFIFFNSFVLANEFKFTTSEIKVLDEGNIIEAKNGKAVSEMVKSKLKLKNLNIKKI